MSYEEDVKNLFYELIASQWNFMPNLDASKKYKVLTRNEFRSIKQKPGIYTSKTSGSTGEQVSVEKYYIDKVWSKALSLRSLIWSKMDPSLNLCQIRTSGETGIANSWGLPEWFARNQGNIFYTKNTDTESLQRWIDRKKPNYIQCFPSIANNLSVDNLPDFRGFFGTGELGGSEYSSEEFGLIAARCPDVPSNYHVSENILVETDDEGNAILTNLYNPYLKRYKIGDVLTLGECSCGRTLQTITSILGRVRNLITYPNGKKAWPMFGSKDFFTKFGIKQYQIVQTTTQALTANVLVSKLDEPAFKEFMQSNLGHKFDITVNYVTEFSSGKFEEFKSLI